MSRTPIDTRLYQAYIKGSRPDVISEGTISVNPFEAIGKRTCESDTQRVSADEQNKAVFSNYDPSLIYQVNVLPGDERSVHKYNGATFNKIDENHSQTNMEAATIFTLPYWFGAYHKMIEYSK